MSGVSCVLSWHVLSEGQVHYQRGHTSLECAECRVCVELARLVRRTSPLPAWTHESRVCWVSCVLSWHVLSEGQVHYQRGHTSLECAECRVCWAGMSCPQDGSCTSHRSVTRCSCSCSGYDDSLGSCLPPCWSSCTQLCASKAKLQNILP